MVILARTFGNWLHIWWESPEGNEIETQALSKLIELASNPKDADWTEKKEALRLSRWIKILAISVSGSETENLSIQKLIEELKKNKEKKIKGYSSKI